MAREINDQQTTWSLAEAYAGLKKDGEETSDAARVEGAKDLVHVVATPNGGAQTVRLHLKDDWESSPSDAELIAKIKSEQK